MRSVWRRGGRCVAGALAVLLWTTLQACSSQSGSAPSSSGSEAVPPDPCALLTTSQLDAAFSSVGEGWGKPTPGDVNDFHPGATVRCDWTATQSTATVTTLPQENLRVEIEPAADWPPLCVTQVPIGQAACISRDGSLSAKNGTFMVTILTYVTGTIANTKLETLLAIDALHNIAGAK